jgi:hypothetical protein
LYKDIVIDEHREEVDAMAMKMSGSGPGTRPYLSCYKNAVTAVKEGLDKKNAVKVPSRGEDME